ncbi:fungal-specific transcription factor domain-containing protein [Aspergillus californicus]
MSTVQPSWGPARLRISRACDRCKRRKIRCTGTQPCDTCIRAAVSCAYVAPYNRGRKPPQVLQRGHNDQEVYLPGHNPPTEANTMAEDSPPRASPEPITDLQGHYIGPASGVSFLARVQNRLQQSKQSSSSFTFGDVPLPDFDPIPSIMISGEETARLVQRFLDFTMPIDRFFHTPTIEEWRQEFCETMGSMRNTDDAPAKRAALWMIFAMAQEHMTNDPNTVDDDRSIRYFLAAEYQVSKGRGAGSLLTVQVRLCQCFWLLSRSRVNHCWDLFGTTARLALVLGLHRKHSPLLSNNHHPISLDCRRRTFWSAYCLDNHLSIIFGRPRIFHDDDIDQELPSAATDEDLRLEHQIEPRRSQNYSVMLAPVAYFRLHRIVSLILRDLYSIQPASISTQCALATKYSQELMDWRDTIPSFLSTDTQESVPLIPIFQRQRDVLNLSYWHALVLMHRPILLRKFALVQRGRSDNTRNAQIESGVSECLAAALHIVKKVEEMFQTGLMFRSFWGTCFYGFSAAVVLYVYPSLVGPASSAAYQTYFDAAVRCQSQLSRIMPGDSLLARYCMVLEELRLEAIKRTEENQSPPQATQETTPAETDTLSVENINSVLYAPITYPDIYGGAFSFPYGPDAVPGNIVMWTQETSTGQADMMW